MMPDSSQLSRIFPFKSDYGMIGVVRVCFAVFTLFLCWLVPARAQQPDVWMSALEPQWRKVWGFAPNDWDQLFEPNAPWGRVASHVQVFELSKRFVMEADDSQLRRVLSFLRDRKIKLALQGTPLVATPACGLGVEGHGPAGDMTVEALRIRDAGGELAYIALDEPLFYGRFLQLFEWKGNLKACDYSISELAAQTAGKIAEVRKIFPSVVVGDIEPFGIPAQYARAWHESLAQWIDAYSAATGQPLAFLQVDLVWHEQTWQSDLLAGAAIAKRKGIPLGIIYNASPNDQEWTSVAADHFHFIESQLKIQSPQIAFRTWTERPQRMLPESDRRTFTGLVLDYLKWRGIE